ncbi:MAG: peroxiredoxin [Candidatus Nanopelagicales bacterium]|jgi:peroxiredoxin|nr:peroxiredoxin [Candidatus Nanopelagicales bacterium]
MSVEVGQPAPEFTLPNQRGEQVSLAELRGRKVVLVFYPFAFSSICTSELCDLRDRRGDFDDDTVLLGVSVDTKHALRVFGEQEGLGFDLLSDFWPHGAVAQAYGVFLPERGMATRGTFVIDREGIVRWALVNHPGQARDPEDYRTALAALE